MTTSPSPSLSITRRRARNLSQSLVDSILQRVAQGVLSIGDKLPTESELMQQYSVSRTVVREALSRLQAGGFIETRHGIGSFIQPQTAQGGFHINPNDLITIQDTLDLLQLRQSLESAAAGIAAMKRTDTDLATMQACLEEFKHQLAHNQETIDTDFRFHLSIAQATGNRHFVDILSHMGQTVIPRTRINTASLGPETQQRYLQRVHDEHQEIYKAILMRNPLVASSAMQMHLNNSTERLRATLTASA